MARDNIPFSNAPKTNFSLQRSRVLNRDSNYVSPTAFRMQIDALKYPTAEFTVQSVTLPDVGSAESPYSSSYADTAFPGSRLQYGDLALSFLVDEYFENYLEVHDWLLASVAQQEANENIKRRDILLQVLSSHNNVIRTIKFIGCFPTNLSGVTFDATLTDVTYLTADATFKISYFKIS